ncbi:hypothetical protein N473_09405 [Pseudoalteromonas luteoviolacea CPMOR-1]|uniref:PKD domain-containing protein n=1 Tax=Pseudoalteromonas luteoviolacea CPMOR-1 TaxID=1365248 RepID=A0A167MLN3_9GAMM|nr:PKD domain-containing protein [Pseudoalteromonas luteoviolacea]KZN66599.1 hypothetical protein N473_09405 [Pseudoalteromonas luteoviolacea CPMOR-1]
MYCIPYLLIAQETAYLWDFGDGTTSTEESPTHEYSTPGIYTVSLTASINEKLSYSQQYEVNAISPAIKSISLALPDMIEVGKRVNARVLLSSDYDLSLDYQWEFPGGLFHTGQEIDFIFDEVGTHAVSVKAYYDDVMVAHDNFEFIVVPNNENTSDPVEPTAPSNQVQTSTAESSSGGTLGWLTPLLLLVTLRKRSVYANALN